MLVKEGRKSSEAVDKFRMVIYPTEDEILADSIGLSEALEFYCVFSFNLDIGALFATFVQDENFSRIKVKSKDLSGLELLKDQSVREHFYDYLLGNFGELRAFEKKFIRQGGRIESILGPGITLPFHKLFASEGQELIKVLPEKIENKINNMKKGSDGSDLITEPIMVGFTISLSEKYNVISEDEELLKILTDKERSGPDLKRMMFKIFDMVVMNVPLEDMVDTILQWGQDPRSVKAIEDVNTMACLDKFDMLAMELKEEAILRFASQRFGVFNSLLTTFGEAPTGSYVIKVEI